MNFIFRLEEEFKKARGLLKESLYYFEKYDSREYPNEEVKDKLLKFVNGTLPLLEDKWDELDDELSKQVIYIYIYIIYIYICIN